MVDTRRARAADREEHGARGAPAPSTPGEILRAARLRRRLSLVEAEQATRIRQRYLQALEDDDYSVLPPGVYSVGFLRNYAIYLGVPPDDVISGSGDPRRRRDRRMSLQSVAPPIQLSAPRTMWLLAGGALIALLLLGLAWLGLSDPNPTPPSAAPAGQAPGASPSAVVSLQPLATAALPTSAPTQVPAPQPTSAPTATANPRQLEIDLRVVDRAWVEATVDGQVAIAKVLEPGTNQRLIGQQSVNLVIGNGAGVEVTANGQRLGLLGAAGQIVERRFTR
jgi:cytoskeleton protein RodZ